ncbi:MAG: DUF2939 domain-containing protein [Syntrophaceae bacterium]
MKRLLIILGALLIGLAVGGGLYLWYPTTPVYTLRQAKQAVQTHDWQAFTQHVDVDSLVNSAALDMAAIMQEAMERRHMSKVLTKSLGALVAIKVRTSLHEDLRNWVTAENPGRKGFLSSLLPNPSGGFTLRLKSVHWWGDTGRARVAVGADTTLVVELTRQADAWRVMRVLNIRELYEKSRAKQSS